MDGFSMVIEKSWPHVEFGGQGRVHLGYATGGGTLRDPGADHGHVRISVLILFPRANGARRMASAMPPANLFSGTQDGSMIRTPSRSIRGGS